MLHDLLGNVVSMKRIGEMVNADLRAFVGLLLQMNNVLNRIWFYLNYDFKLGKISISLTSLAMGIAVLLLALFISKSSRGFLQNRLSKRSHIDRGIQYTIIRLVHYAIVTVGVLYALRVAFDLDLTSLAVVFTALSVGIGFGLQYIAHDIASGFILLFERPVRIGDRISIDNQQGDVLSINLRTTVVITNDLVSMIVPNSKLVSQQLINWTYPDRRARLAIPIGVAYGSDVELVTNTLMQASEGVNDVLDQPPPKVQFMKFGDSSLDFRLLVWTSKPRAHIQIRSDINYKIEGLFRAAHIEIPSPQLDLRVRGGALQIDSGGDVELASRNVPGKIPELS